MLTDCCTYAKVKELALLAILSQHWCGAPVKLRQGREWNGHPWHQLSLRDKNSIGFPLLLDHSRCYFLQDTYLIETRRAVRRACTMGLLPLRKTEVLADAIATIFLNDDRTEIIKKRNSGLGGLGDTTELGNRATIFFGPSFQSDL